MPLQRERRTMPAGTFPRPAPLPSLRDALARRAAVFGPFDADPAPAAPRGVLARCSAALRGLAELLEPRPINSHRYDRAPCPVRAVRRRAGAS